MSISFRAIQAVTLKQCFQDLKQDIYFHVVTKSFPVPHKPIYVAVVTEKGKRDKITAHVIMEECMGIRGDVHLGITLIKIGSKATQFNTPQFLKDVEGEQLFDAFVSHVRSLDLV